MDGVAGLTQPHILPGETYVYEFTLRQQGTLMYHPHSDEMVQLALGKRIEEVFGWMKTVGNFRKTRFRGFGANQLAAYMVGAAYNLLRVARLLAAPA
jgi:hypothetical protein